MTRPGRLTLALLLLLVLPTAGAAQKDSKFTKEADKYIGLAMTRQDVAARNQMYQQALTQLKQGMEQDAQNAKVWLKAGIVYAALGELTQANDAWTKALQMHAPYAAEILEEREAAWIQAFNVGLQAMDKQDYPTAIKLLEGAELLYAKRPEALMNLGALYANQGETAKAEEAFRKAIDATKGELFNALEAEQKAEWVRFREMAQVNIAQIKAAEGVDAFQADSFEDAATKFKTASEMNPHARDYIFNHAQALWAQASKIEEAMEKLPAAEAPAAKAKAIALYNEIEALTKKTRDMDPNNESLIIIEARAHRMRGEYAGNDAQKQAGSEAALKLLQLHDVMTVLLDEVTVTPQADQVQIRGKVKNKKLAEGATVNIKFTLVGLDGSVVAEQTVAAKVGAVDADAVAFEGAVPAVKGEVAGWKYKVEG